MKNKFLIILIAVFCVAFFLAPPPTTAQEYEPLSPLNEPDYITPCRNLIDGMRENLIASCRSAGCNDSSNPNCCPRIDLGTGEQLCEFNIQPTGGEGQRCLPKQGAVGLLCERKKAAGRCRGECPESSSTFHSAPVEDIKFEPTLPRLQIDIPGLQPFTKASLKTTEEGDTVMLDVNFIGPYLVALYKYLVGISGIMAGIMIVWAGVNWLTSAGSPDKIGEAKKKIAGAVVGLILVLGSYIILQILNPELVIFKPLRVEYIKQELLVIDNFSVPESSSDTPAGDFDSLFQKYANCAGVDWRVLRMIAQKESSLRPGFVNGLGFIGLFQTKPEYCNLPAQFKDHCTVEQLKNPAVNIAVGANNMKAGLKLIDDYCPNGDPRAQFTIVYGVNSSGKYGTEAALQYAKTHGGCTVDNLRKGFIEFWKTYTPKKCGGQTCINGFLSHFGRERCRAYADINDCMGGEKYNHTLRAADAYIAQGGEAVRTQPVDNLCPLNNPSNPFPSS